MTKRIRLIGAIALAVAVWGYIIVPYTVKTYKQEMRKKMYLYNSSLIEEVGWMMVDYEQGHNYRLPDAGKWEDELAPYNKGHLSMVLQTSPGAKPHRIAMNKFLSGVDTRAINTSAGNVILLYEKETNEKNANGNPTEALNASRVPDLGCLASPGYGSYYCSQPSDFALSSDTKAMEFTP